MSKNIAHVQKHSLGSVPQCDNKAHVNSWSSIASVFVWQTPYCMCCFYSLLRVCTYWCCATQAVRQRLQFVQHVTPAACWHLPLQQHMTVHLYLPLAQHLIAHSAHLHLPLEQRLFASAVYADFPRRSSNSTLVPVAHSTLAPAVRTAHSLL